MDKEKVKKVFEKLNADTEATILRNEINKALDDKDHEGVESAVHDLMERIDELFEEDVTDLQEYATQWLYISRLE